MTGRIFSFRDYRTNRIKSLTKEGDQPLHSVVYSISDRI